MRGTGPADEPRTRFRKLILILLVREVDTAINSEGANVAGATSARNPWTAVAVSGSFMEECKSSLE